MMYYVDRCEHCGEGDIHLDNDCPGLQDEGIPVHRDGPDDDEDTIGLVLPIKKCPVLTIAPPFDKPISCKAVGGWDVGRAGVRQGEMLWEAYEVVRGSFCEAHAKKIAQVLNPAWPQDVLERLLDDIRVAA